MSETKTYSGRCLCVAVSYTAEVVNGEVHASHCATCRKWSGASMLAMGTAAVDFTGASNIARYDSSEWAQRGFCRNCGSNLFYQLKDQGNYIMCVGAFDDSPDFELCGEIYIDEKPSGYDFAGEHSRMTGAEFMASIGSGDSTS